MNLDWDKYWQTIGVFLGTLIAIGLMLGIIVFLKGLWMEVLK